MALKPMELLLIGGVALGGFYLWNRGRTQTTGYHQEDGTYFEASQPTIRTIQRQDARTDRTDLRQDARTERTAIRRPTTPVNISNDDRNINIPNANQWTTRTALRTTGRTDRTEIRQDARTTRQTNTLNFLGNAGSNIRTALQNTPRPTTKQALRTASVVVAPLPTLAIRGATNLISKLRNRTGE